MPTLDLIGLTQLLERFSVSSPSTELTEANILTNPLVLCRSILAELLTSLVQCDIQDAYKSIQCPNNIFNGDLSVTLPRLRPGCKPTELSTELVDKVRKPFHKVEIPDLTLDISSLKIMPYSNPLCPKVFICASSSNLSQYRVF